MVVLLSAVMRLAVMWPAVADAAGGVLAKGDAFGGGLGVEPLPVL